jgi:hypothetical protein
VVNFTFSNPPRANVTNMFGKWLNGVKKAKLCIHIDTYALIWALWNYRNDMVFNKAETAHLYRLYVCTTGGAKAKQKLAVAP